MISTLPTKAIPDYWRWFPEARLGMFIHWGPYAVYGRGEQVLFRERLDQHEYAQAACNWNPQHADPAAWVKTAKRMGMKYAVLTTRHHDGFCLWDSKLTDYTTACQAAKRDFVREYVDACRAEGLRVGLYYSLADWRIPAYWAGSARDPEGWETFRNYVHGQVRELLTNYGQVDEFWFDGAWPHSAVEWKSWDLVDMMRELQPHILINNRLGVVPKEVMAEMGEHADGGLGAGESKVLGDFGTPEHHITADATRIWESCNTMTWRLWGFTNGERWRGADQLLDMILDAAGKGGNMLLNVGPTADGEMPPEAIERAEAIGEWMDVHSEVVFNTEPGDVCEFVTYGRQMRSGNTLYLVIRFWDGRETLHLGGLAARVKRATLLTTGQELPFTQTEDDLYVHGLPKESPTKLFPVIKLECEGPLEARPWAVDRLWCGDSGRMTEWAAARGTSVFTDGKAR